MIIPDSKKTVTMILSRMGEDRKMTDTEIKPERENREEDEGFRVIAEEILEAIQEKSTSGLARALRNFVEQHELSKYEREE